MFTTYLTIWRRIFYPKNISTQFTLVIFFFIDIKKTRLLSFTYVVWWFCFFFAFFLLCFTFVKQLRQDQQCRLVVNSLIFNQKREKNLQRYMWFLQIITVPFCQLIIVTRFSAAILTAVILILEREKEKENE